MQLHFVGEFYTGFAADEKEAAQINITKPKGLEVLSLI